MVDELMPAIGGHEQAHPVILVAKFQIQIGAVNDHLRADHLANIRFGKLQIEQLLAIGATKTADIQNVGGGIKKVIVLDPFGNPFGLMENPNFGK